jgi:hypothetical protein
MKSETINCIEMKRRGAERVLAETAGMTSEQELEYWRAATDALRAEQREARAGRSPRQGVPARPAS